LRVEVTPHPVLDAFAGYRISWLASSRDGWTTAGLRDPSGDSGSFLGSQVELRIRYSPLPKNLALELGGAYLVRGSFIDEVPMGKRANPVFVYTQVTGTI
jgi:hypothetical protein